MKQKVMIVFVLFVTLSFFSSSVFAMKDSSFSLPAQAVEISPGIYHLGSTLSSEGKIVEGIAFVDYRKENAGQSKAIKGNGSSTCYNFLASGAKWKVSESWVMNPTTTSGLNASFVFSHLSEDIQKWETAAGYNIFGIGSLTSLPLSAESTSPDGVNEIYFGSIAEPGVIAVTIVWGVFRGPLPQRSLVEWDQVYDQDDYAWSTIGESGKMDFDNIATHELGHAAGMGHPANTCTEETMYAYADYGETKKRDLNAGDITGIKALYK